ncbi:MAG: hypothetical protein WCI78_16240 [Mycobacterium sp.]
MTGSIEDHPLPPAILAVVRDWHDADEFAERVARIDRERSLVRLFDEYPDRDNRVLVCRVVELYRCDRPEALRLAALLPEVTS